MTHRLDHFFINLHDPFHLSISIRHLTRRDPNYVVTGGGLADTFPVLHKNCFTEGIAGLIHDGDIEIAGTGTNWEIIIAVIVGHAFGDGTVTVAPLIHIRHTHPSHWRPTAVEHLP